MPLNLAHAGAAMAPPEDLGSLIAVYDAMPFPVALIDQEGNVFHLNAAFERAWCGPHAGRLTNLIHPEDRYGFHARLREHVADVTERIQIRLAAADGEIRWVDISLMPASQQACGGPFTAALFTDITPFKGEIAELTDRENRWNSALVSSVTGVWDHNWATGQKYYSPTWRRIRGMAPDDPLPESTAAWIETLHPDDRDHVIHCVERQNAGDINYAVFEYRERHKDGHWMWIECRGDCIEWDESGKPTRIVGTDTDVTGRKLAEEAVARLAKRLEMALEISNVGTYECDLTTGIVDWDDRMYRIYGLDTREEVRVGGLWEAFLHPDDADDMTRKLDEQARDGTRFAEQFRVRLRDGSERIIRARTTSFLDASGHNVTIGANWDVTEDVGLHRELERAKTLAEARAQELEIARDRIEHTAMHDYLTELPNRRYLDDMLRRMSAQCRRDGTGIAILHVDLDRFKEVNDTLGHDAGDTILLHAAQMLRDTLRKDDFIARVGGDEFIVVSRLDGAQEPLPDIATRMIEAISEPCVYEGRPCHIGASIGVATAHGDNIEIRQLLRNSDIALYEAKQQGRNRFVFFGKEA